MATVNIRPDAAEDGFYRYKMALLMTKIEGKGNGIKTVIPNMSEIAKSLGRPATYPTKFFGCELGAQTVFDEPADRYIVNGAHDATRLRELLYTFIEKFVLCSSCRNPETALVITKDDSILRDCKACGVRRPVDMKHKLCTFILRNPPPKPDKKKAIKIPGTTTTVPSIKKSSKAHGNSKDDSEHAEEDGDVIAEGEDELAMPEIDLDRPADENWSVDTSKEAVAARVSELAAGVQTNLVLDGEKVASNGNAHHDGNGAAAEDEEDEGPYGAFGKWVSENKAATDVEIYKHAQELGIVKSSKTVQALVLGLFDENVLQNLKLHEALFQKLVTSEKHQKALLGGLEIFVGEQEPNLMSLVPKILMVLYQADVLEDEVVQHWGTHTSKKYVDKDISKKVRRSAAPFLKWLEEADDESDEDSE